ncbi:hypothetical protein CCNA_03986 [Caulobacter vibrioides NA1000]|uniref:Uncharacterized protein n=1 Tax=Caulobacter vibrioides (strain NA1000 / CB15N) TaxID=565050 RepID=A0A0H3IZK9_CAUVN|nr:hypothetical protein [Caulobacter vibrioides]YP_009020558.1 hypothetical protein CCNA_03986 [Caulobacter vibrioides NA1000]AHI88589.1 hypothetical protein CCNA_03986 [Caulobacter vibrioides NA1000]
MPASVREAEWVRNVHCSAPYPWRACADGGHSAARKAQDYGDRLRITVTVHLIPERHQGWTWDSARALRALYPDSTSARAWNIGLGWPASSRGKGCSQGRSPFAPRSQESRSRTPQTVKANRCARGRSI